MVHSFYSSRQPSGENTVVLNEVDALRRAGHDVALFATHTDEVEGSRLYRLRAGLRVATGIGKNPLSAIEDFGPDIVHVHNLFPNFGRRWVADVEQPVVHTLHNYRPLCASGDLFRDGQICTLCPDGDTWASLRYACYRDSRAATLPQAIAVRGGTDADPLLRRADRIVLLSPLQRQIYLDAGLPRDRLVVAENFLPRHLDPGGSGAGAREGFLVVGRLSPEKGILELLAAWPEGYQLTVAGDGPLRRDVEQAAGRGVTVVGAVDRRRVIDLMRCHRALVFPSRAPEALPLIYVEALAADLPTLAFAGNAVAALVERDRSGLVHDWSAPLGDRVQAWLSDEPIPRGRCRRLFDERYSESVFARSRTSLYDSLLARHR